MMSTGAAIRNDIDVNLSPHYLIWQKHHLHKHSMRFFFEVRPQLIWYSNFNLRSINFSAVLWVTQEILKLVPTNPPWAQTAGQMHVVQGLSWDNPSLLQAEAMKNTHLILHYNRFFMGGQQGPPMPNSSGGPGQGYTTMHNRQEIAMTRPGEQVQKPRKDRVLKRIQLLTRSMFMSGHRTA